MRGGSLYSDPCHDDDALPDIPVGPTAADFADALAAHPLLDVTTPVDVTLAGYTGKYLDLQVPTDSWHAGGVRCDYRPWELGFVAFPAGGRSHLWILDVDGIRVVIQAIDQRGHVARGQGAAPGHRGLDLHRADHGSRCVVIAGSAGLDPRQRGAGLAGTGPHRARRGPRRRARFADGGYTDPAGDIASPDMPWIDIQRVTVKRAEDRVSRRRRERPDATRGLERALDRVRACPRHGRSTASPT